MLKKNHSVQIRPTNLESGENWHWERLTWCHSARRPGWPIATALVPIGHANTKCQLASNLGAPWVLSTTAQQQYGRYDKMAQMTMGINIDVICIISFNVQTE